MKTLPSVRSLLIVIMVGAGAFARETTAEGQDALIVFGVPRRAMIGMNRDQVVTSMQGQPDEKLSRDVWIYWDCHMGGLQSQHDTYTALIIIFVADRVKFMRLTDAEATKTALTRYRGTGGKAVAAQ